MKWEDGQLNRVYIIFLGNFRWVEIERDREKEIRFRN